MKRKCKGCKYSNEVTEVRIFKGTKTEKDGFICCHSSEKVIPGVFTGKTSPNWCPLKTEDSVCLCNTDKSDFVEFSLYELLNRIDENIIGAAYSFDENNGEEYCTLKYKDGYTKKICVTADSLAALARDVLEKI